MNEPMTPSAALEVLGLSPGASRAEVTRAYRALIASVHPDLADADDDRQRRSRHATRVNVAYELLSKTGTGIPQQDVPPTQPSSPPNMPDQDKPPATVQREKTSRPEANPDHQVRVDGRKRRTRTALWFTVTAGVLAVLGAGLRLLHFWDGLLAPTPWGDESAGLGLGEIALRAVLGVLLTWLIGHGGVRISTITLAAAAVLYTSFSEVSIRLNWAEESLLFAGLVLVPLYFAVRRHLVGVVTSAP